MNAGVEQEPPVFEQRRLGGIRRSFAGSGVGKQQQRFRQIAIRV